jgi:hypothetical protein
MFIFCITSYFTSPHSNVVRYIVRQAPSCPEPRLLLPLSSALHRQAVAKLALLRLRGVNASGSLRDWRPSRGCNAVPTCSTKSWLLSIRSS